MPVEVIQKFEQEAAERRKALEQEVAEAQAAIAPKVEELEELNKYLTAAHSDGAQAQAPAAAAPKSSNGRRRGRQGKRLDEFVNLVGENPGITVSEVAEKMGIGPNYLYRIAENALKAKRVRKRKREYFPVEEEGVAA